MFFIVLHFGPLILLLLRVVSQEKQTLFRYLLYPSCSLLGLRRHSDLVLQRNRNPSQRPTRGSFIRKAEWHIVSLTRQNQVCVRLEI